MVSVEARQHCTCHPSPPNSEVLLVLQQVTELRPQALQRDLQVHDDKNEHMHTPDPASPQGQWHQTSSPACEPR